MKFEYEYLKTEQEVIDQIRKCEGVHTQQSVYSTFHDALTQVCFGCKRIRTNIYLREDYENKKRKYTRFYSWFSFWNSSSNSFKFNYMGVNMKYGVDTITLEEFYEMFTGEKYPTRSIAGKKAYQTFLKNGGTRNSKGQFSKKFSWQKVYDEVREVSNYIDFLVEKEKIVKWDRITKIYLKVFQKHGLIGKEVEI